MAKATAQVRARLKALRKRFKLGEFRTAKPVKSASKSTRRKARNRTGETNMAKRKRSRSSRGLNIKTLANNYASGAGYAAISGSPLIGAVAATVTGKGLVGATGAITAPMIAPTVQNLVSGLLSRTGLTGVNSSNNSTGIPLNG